MSMVQTMFVLAVGAMSLLGWNTLMEADRERLAVRADVERVAAFQSAFYRWHADERTDDVDGYTTPATADVAAFANNYLPSGYLTGDTVGVSDLGGGSYLMSGGGLAGAFREVGLTWDTSVAPATVTARFIGPWPERSVHFAQGALPYLEGPFAPVSPFATGADYALMRVDLPHPGNTASMTQTVRRFTTAEASTVEGLVSPLAFDHVAVNNEPCGEVGAVTVNSNGLPMACMDADNNGRGEWKTVVASNMYCRDIRLTPASPDYYLNMANAVPVVEVDVADYATQTVAFRTVRQRGVRTGPSTVVCPTGFSPPASPATDDLCTRQFNADGVSGTPGTWSPPVSPATTGTLTCPTGFSPPANPSATNTWCTG